MEYSLVCYLNNGGPWIWYYLMLTILITETDRRTKFPQRGQHPCHLAALRQLFGRGSLGLYSLYA